MLIQKIATLLCQYLGTIKFDVLVFLQDLNFKDIF